MTRWWLLSTHMYWYQHINTWTHSSTHQRIIHQHSHQRSSTPIQSSTCVGALIRWYVDDYCINAQRFNPPIPQRINAINTSTQKHINTTRRPQQTPVHVIRTWPALSQHLKILHTPSHPNISQNL
jgi:hypothetical protein